MSSETSTDTATDSGFRSWHLYLLMSMAAATVAVWRALDTQPAALLLLSAGVVAAGLVAIGVHYAVLGFMGEFTLEREPLDERTLLALHQEKAVVLRAIKELEFDRAMGKMGESDFAELDASLRGRAVALMAQIEATPVPAGIATAPETGAEAPRDGACPSCHGAVDVDARFCKACGHRLTNE